MVPREALILEGIRGWGVGFGRTREVKEKNG
jgi:hypothetical protein